MTKTWISLEGTVQGGTLHSGTWHACTPLLMVTTWKQGPTNQGLADKEFYGTGIKTTGIFLWRLSAWWSGDLIKECPCVKFWIIKVNMMKFPKFVIFYQLHISGLQSKIDVVSSGIQDEKSRKNTASSGKLVSTIEAQASPPKNWTNYNIIWTIFTQLNRCTQKMSLRLRDTPASPARCCI